MTREEIQQALTKINQSIAQLNTLLHPPPADPSQRQELEAELQSTEQARAALEQALNNMPQPTPDPVLGLTAARIRTFRITHARAETTAAIRVSQVARKRADKLIGILEPVNDRDIRGGVIKPSKPQRT
jgi:DNA repair exonuclease SbcCD ATPase subunit